MPSLLDTLSPGELLHASHINRIDTSPVIGQQRSQWSTDNLTPIHHRNRVPEKPVAVRENRVVHAQVLQDLDHGQRRTGQDTLLQAPVTVQEANILEQVEDISVAEALDIFTDISNLLQVLVLAVVENWVVDDDAVDGVVGVGGQDGAFEFFAVNFAQGELASTADDVSGIFGV